MDLSTITVSCFQVIKNTLNGKFLAQTNIKCK